MVVGPSRFVTVKLLQRWATLMGTGTIELCFLAVVQHMPTVLGVVARADHLSQEKNFLVDSAEPFVWEEWNFISNS